MKIDPYKHKEKYQAWKIREKGGISGISKENSDLILKYLNDMEVGSNIAKGSVKGARSFIRLNTLRDKLCFFAKNFEAQFKLNSITEISEEQLIGFFAGMKNGNIRKIDGPFARQMWYSPIERQFNTYEATNDRFIGLAPGRGMLGLIKDKH
jgi:hypothetical protein